MPRVNLMFQLGMKQSKSTQSGQKQQQKKVCKFKYYIINLGHICLKKKQNSNILIKDVSHLQAKA